MTPKRMAGLILLLLACLLPLVHRAAEIHDAVAAGDLAQVQALYAATPASVSQADTNGATPLQLAVAGDRAAIAGFLVLDTPCIFRERFVDTRSAEGQRALGSGLLQKAHRTFLGLVKANPQHERASYALGLTSSSLGELDGARLAFQNALAVNPANHRTRAELARVLVQQRQYDQAESVLNRAYDHHMTPVDRRHIEGMLQELRREAKRSAVSGRLDIGYLYDDNVNVGPESDVVGTVPIIYGSATYTRLLVPEGSQPREVRGGFSAVGISGYHDPGERKHWIICGEGGFYCNWLPDHSDNETLFAQAGVGLQHVSGDRAFYVPLLASHIEYGHETLATMWGLHPVYATGMGRSGGVQWLTRATVQARDYAKLDERDGLYVAGGETARQFFGASGHSLELGVTVFGEFTDSDVYANSGLVWILRTTLNLPWRSVLRAQASYSSADYREKESLAPERRADTLRQYGVALDKRIADGWGVELTLQHTDNDSTFALYQYERNMVTLSTYLVF